MKRLFLLLAFLAPTLAACGSHGSALLPPTAYSPSIDAPASSSARVVKGRVFRLAGPLSAENYPDGGASPLPGPTAGPQAGRSLRDVTVYLVDYRKIAVPGVPKAPLTITKTGKTGYFTLAVPSSYTQPFVGLVAIAGDLNGTTGVSTRGWTVSHVAIALPATNSVDVYLDHLTADEHSAFTALNVIHSQAKIPPAYADTGEQMEVRLYTSIWQSTPRCITPGNAFLKAMLTRLGFDVPGTEVSGGGALEFASDGETWPVYLRVLDVSKKNVLLGLHASYNVPCKRVGKKASAVDFFGGVNWSEVPGRTDAIMGPFTTSP